MSELEYELVELAPSEQEATLEPAAPQSTAVPNVGRGRGFQRGRGRGNFRGRGRRGV